MTRQMMMAAVMAASVVVAGGAAWGQVQRVNLGNGMDANSQVGSGGANQPVQGFVPVNGNDIISGNVAGLKYFHGNIPYSNVNEFHGTLGSSALSNFARQSAGPPPTQVNTGLTTPYYLPSRQVSNSMGNYYPTPTGGGMDSRFAPGSSLSPLARTSDLNSPLSQGVPINAAAAMRRFDAMGNDITDVGPLTPSGLFGFRTALSNTPGVLDPREKERLELEKERLRTDLGKTQRIGAATEPEGPVGSEVKAQVDANPEADSDVYNALESTISAKMKSGAATKPGAGGVPGAEDVPGGGMMGVPGTTLPGLRGANALGGRVPTQSTDPAKPFYVAPGAVKKPLTEEGTEKLRSGKDVKPLETFSGKRPSVFNQYMETAEQQMREGRFIDASQTYADAGDFAPNNPLPLVGRVHAEMGAGLYTAAATDLQTLFEKRPELIAVRYDLKKFIPKERVDFLVRDLSDLSRKGGRPNPGANFLVAYVDYQLDRKEDLKLQLEYWAGQDRKNTWPGILTRAWVEDK